jgi:sugar phosphate isomerase/epimerase
MMGDGVIDIQSLRGAVEAQGYDGFVEVEILSNDWWSRPLGEVLDTVIARFNKVV